jgi:hypothetical protein
MGKIAFEYSPSSNKTLTATMALKPGETAEWRALRLKGRLWRYLWKAPYISPYRLKGGLNS